LVGGDGGQALLHVATVRFQMNLGQPVQQRFLGARQVAAGFEVIGQALGLVAGPCLKGEHELALVDQAVLKREQSEQEMAVSGGGHDRFPIVVGRSGESPGIGAGPGVESPRLDYRKSATHLHP
jgi:hypothetical protein